MATVLGVGSGSIDPQADVFGPSFNGGPDLALGANVSSQSPLEIPALFPDPKRILTSHPVPETSDRLARKRRCTIFFEPKK